MHRAHVISHTHWDREWYMSFQHFRMRLVELVDKLLELLETDESFRYFTFDGQTIMLEDYLAIRPENAQRLRKLIADGRILIGPWYNQPDEFLVSGECIIRNLLKGKRLCEDFGGYMAVAYIPDQFGHISQFPQILRGFGIDSAVTFRAITTDQVDSEFTWESPDGSQVLAVKMPDENAYSNWFYRHQETLRYPDKPVDPRQAADSVAALVQDCVNERPTTSQLLFMDGCDHVFAQFKTPEIIAAANERLDNVTVEHSTLPAFIEAVRKENPKLQTYRGELRWSNRKWKLQALLANTLSSRIHLKQASHACETLLERYVEPLCAWNWMLGDDYPQSYIDLAWEYLLKNSPHDSICGCSIDQVHRDMMYRYDQTRLIGEKLMARAIGRLASRIGSEAENPDRTVLAMGFNPLSHTRTDVVEAGIDFPGGWSIPGLRVLDPQGQEVPCAILGIEHYHDMEPEPYDIPQGTHKQTVKVAFVAEDVHSVGYKAYRVEALERPNRMPGTMLLGPDTAENEHLSITVGADGSLYVLDKETDAAFVSCLVFEDGGDFGDGYNYVKPMSDKVVTSIGARSTVSVVEDNAVRVVFEIETDLELPVGAAPGQQARSAETVICKARTRIALTAKSKRIDIETVFDNRAKDHRLRVLFPSGLPARVSHAEGAFDVIEREIAVPECKDWKEPLPSMHPQKGFVDVSGGGIGLAIINKGLPEYEAKDDAARTVALTLLRATGNGVCGPAHQKDGQLLGEHVFEYAIYPHAGDWREGDVVAEAHGFNVPLVVGQTGIHAGEMPMEKGFVEVGDERFLVTAVKRSVNGAACVVRAFNVSDEPIEPRVSVDGASELRPADLKEDPTGEPSRDRLHLRVDPKQIATILAAKSRA